MYRPGNEWQEAREERAADFRRFNDNEARIESGRFERANDDEARKARLSKNAALIAKLEGGSK